LSGEQPRWWALRPAQSLKPATYRCPLCGKHLPALSQCVLRARKAGRLPTEDEWRAAQRAERSSSRIPGTSAFARLRARLFGKD